MASAAEAEICASFLAAQESVPIVTCLNELGHKQPPTPIRVDNSTAVGFLNNTIKQKRSKSIDMRFYWLQDRCDQGQFQIYWAPGATNLADYHSKHHPPSHHQKLRDNFQQRVHVGKFHIFFCEGVIKPKIYFTNNMRNIQNYVRILQNII